MKQKYSEKDWMGDSYYSQRATELYEAFQVGDEERIKILLTHGANINNSWDSSMPFYHSFIKAGNIEGIKLLMKYNASTKILYNCSTLRDSEKIKHMTPLHYATLLGKADIVKVLLNKVEESSKEFSLLSSIVNFFSYIISPFKQSKPELDLQTKNGNTALHIACLKEHDNIARELIKHGINVNVKNCNGDTALHIACSKPSSIFLIKELLNFGSDLLAKNKLGYKPIDIAKNEGLLCTTYSVLHEMNLKGLYIEKQGYKLLKQTLKNALSTNNDHNPYTYLNKPIIDFINYINKIIAGDPKPCASNYSLLLFYQREIKPIIEKTAEIIKDESGNNIILSEEREEYNNTLLPYTKAIDYYITKNILSITGIINNKLDGEIVREQAIKDFFISDNFKEKLELKDIALLKELSSNNKHDVDVVGEMSN
jgi:ankyrin repeat protein